MATTQVTTARKAPDRLFIAGEWVDSRTTFPVYNPATGAVLTEVAEAGDAEVNAAVVAARSALESKEWRSLSASDRGALIWRISDALEARSADLVRLEVLNTGKPLREAQIDLREAIDAF